MSLYIGVDIHCKASLSTVQNEQLSVVSMVSKTPVRRTFGYQRESFINMGKIILFI